MNSYELMELAEKVKAMPDSFFEGLELFLVAYDDTQKEKIRKALEPELKIRGITPTQFPKEFLDKFRIASRKMRG